jgi:lysyl-tRNA synthetase, class II
LYIYLYLVANITLTTRIAFTGYPTKTSTGQLSLQITALPKLLSPSLHKLPETVTDEQTLARFPQLELVLRRKKRDLLRIRHTVEMTVQNFLNSKSFTKVSTPVLAADTGGAVARAFETNANEFSGHTLKLRIAQELELKKLVAAGMGAVYEIGPVFRNEGKSQEKYVYIQAKTK